MLLGCSVLVVLLVTGTVMLSSSVLRVPTEQENFGQTGQ